MVQRSSVLWHQINDIGRKHSLERSDRTGSSKSTTALSHQEFSATLMVAVIGVLPFCKSRWDWLHYDLDELISARPAASYSYRNPIEHCHAIANLGLQSIGMIRESMESASEKNIKHLNSKADIRKAFENHKELEKYVVWNRKSLLWKKCCHACH